MTQRHGGWAGLTLLVLLSFPSGLFAQPADAGGWHLSATFNLTHTQSAYSDNWDGDEQGQITWKSQLNSIVEKQLSELLNSRNTLDLEYGQAQTQDRTSNSWSRPAKNADKIELESVLRFTLHSWVDPYVSGRFLSQFTDRRSGEIEWVNPITLTESAGISRTLLKDEEKKQEWLARAGLGVQEYIDRKTPVMSEDAQGNPVTGFKSQTTTYAGLELVSELVSRVINENVRVDSKLILFQALYNSKAEDLKGLPNENDWQSPDLDWETIFTANITKVLMVNLTTRLLYDKEIDKGGRFKEILGLGITYVLI